MEFPDLIQVTGKQIRLDDIEIIGQYSNRERFFSEQNYNVLFISIDDLKPMLGLYGDTVIQTPNLDRLAERGIAFSNAHCQQAICNASRVSVMTGLRVDTTKTWQLETLFRDTVPNVITLPQHFAANGYTTYGIGKSITDRMRPAKMLLIPGRMDGSIMNRLTDTTELLQEPRMRVIIWLHLQMQV